MPTEIFVATPLRHPRLRYVLDVVGADLGYRFRYYNDRSRFPSPAPSFLIAYGGPAGAHRLPAHELLSGKLPAPAFPPPPVDRDGLPVFCLTDEGPDLLACIFFALSRYEEYGDVARDVHGRYPATASHAYRHGYLQRPIVREWTAALGRQLRTWFPALPPPQRRPFTFQPTYDVDIAWAYRHRGWRGLASGIKDALTGHLPRAVQRLRATASSDPFFTFDALIALHRQHALTPRWFWLVSDGKRREDPNPFPLPVTQIKLIQSLAKHSDYGLHPSYLSYNSSKIIEGERDRLQTVLQVDVTHSRQHFLRFQLPVTYRLLLDAGLTHDHSMGYADAVGWRAGTNLPFPWYDLEREQATTLTVHPFAAMDVTLKQYLHLTGGDAGAMIMELAHTTLPFGGPFTLLWHNSSFADVYGWAGWWQHYQATVTKLARLGQTGPLPRDTALR